MANCWERRGCDDEMMARCPHNIGRDLCPTECWNAACYRSNHIIATDFELLLNSDRDYSAAIKETCHFCEFFLKHGPSLSERGDAAVDADAARRQATRFLI